MTCAIVLAAGESRRMGSQKMLLPYGSTTVIAHIADQLLESAVHEIIVIVGHEGDRVAAELSGRAVSVVSNPDYTTGMLSSVRCGLRALPAACRTVLVALGDQPGITSALVNALVSAYEKSEKAILVPLYQGRRGHPLLFAKSYRDEIQTHYDDVGLRGLLRAYPDEVLEEKVDTAAVLSDMDYPEDYRRELAALEARLLRTDTD